MKKEELYGTKHYRSMLVRYMARVIAAESVSFADGSAGYEEYLTPEETAFLVDIIEPEARAFEAKADAEAKAKREGRP